MLTTSTLPLAPGVWTLDPLHCTVEFTVRHMAISKVRGRFHTFHANVVVGNYLQTTSVRAVVDLASVDTNNDDRDAHLRSSDFFAVDAHPQMTFTSTAITEAGPQRYEVTGDLSVNGITRSEVLIVTFNGMETYPLDGSVHAASRQQGPSAARTATSTSTSPSALAGSSSATRSASNSISSSEVRRHELPAAKLSCEANVSLVAVRVARPTVDLDRIRSFYQHVVGLPLLWSFADHDGFDGAIFGLPDESAQLELVRSPHGDVPGPTNEDALVLYHGAEGDGARLIERLRRAGTVEITADDPTLNPYWPRRGARAFVDPDGYHLIIAPT